MAEIIQPSLLLLAYRSGIFPMADTRDDPDVFWVEPKRRGILPLEGFHCSHSLARVLRRGRFRVTCNADFRAVMRACAAPRAREGGETWISERIEASYVALHEAGHAHSVECWLDGALVGGLYGVGFDRVFCGESMFSRVADASKVALAWLVVALKAGGVELLDCQFLTDHLASMGAVEVSQQSYLTQLRDAQRDVGAQRQSGADSGAGAGAAEALPSAFAGLLAAAKSSGFSSSPGKLIAQSLTQTS